MKKFFLFCVIFVCLIESINADSKKHKYFPKDRAELLALLKDERIKLDSINTSRVKDFSLLFCASIWSRCEDSAKNRKDFKGIESWDTSAITDMNNMFYRNINFNENIESWNVSNVENIESLFREATSFNQPLNSWNTSSVKNMRGIFYGAKSFNQPLNKWNVTSVNNLNGVFAYSGFNQNIDSWNPPKNANIKNIFLESKMEFLPKWTSNFDEFKDVYKNHKFVPLTKNALISLLKDENVKLDSINTSSVTDFSYLFCLDGWEHCLDSARDRADFSGIESWDTSNVADMTAMFFKQTKFNKNLNSWNVSKVADMTAMFSHAYAFNSPLDKWNVKNVKEFGLMFSFAKSFN